MLNKSGDPGAVARTRIQAWCGRFVFGGLRGIVNRGIFPFYLSYRPDSEFIFKTLASDGHRADWIHGNATNNLGDLGRMYSILLNVQQIVAEHVAGDYAELGVYKGNSAKLLADLARAAGCELLLFDTFDGFDDCDRTGIDSNTIRHQFSDTSLEAVRRFVGTERVRYVPGRFPDSITADAADRRYALVHLDCDLYAPTREALRFFYPRLSPGGLLLIHDYSAGSWAGVRRAVDEFLPDIPEQLMIVPDKSGTAVLRRNRW